MKDNALIQLIGAQVTASLAAQSVAATIEQTDQPTLQGRPNGNLVTIQKLFDHPYGSPDRNSYVYKSATNTFDNTEVQVYETTIQIGVYVPQDALDDDLPTASDVCNAIKAWMTGGPTIRTFTAAGASVLKVSQVRNVPFQNDADQQEFLSQFDIVFIHNGTVTFSVGAAQTVRQALEGI